MSREHSIRVTRLLHTVGQRPELTGCAVVAALMALSLFTTDWKPYARQPDEIMGRVAETRSALDQAVWPESERAGFVNVENTSIAAVVTRQMYGDISHDIHRNSRRIRIWPGQYLKLQEPELERVRHMVASTERVLLELKPTASSPAEGGADDHQAVDIDTVEWKDEFLTREPARGRQDPEMAVPWFEGVIDPDEESLVGQMASRDGRGYPFVSVRGLFDVSAQISAFADAIHRNEDVAEKRLELIDFHLERQTFDMRRDAWSPWEPVDVQVFRDVALSASGFEPDVVSSAATDSVITCPLLMRITGRWQTQATHPLLQSAQLSLRELELESAFHSAILELTRRQQQPPRASGVAKGGFWDLVHDARTLEEDLFDPILSGTTSPMPRQDGFGMSNRGGGRPGQQLDRIVEELLPLIADRIDPQPTDRDLRGWIRNRIARSASRLLLFRYFDFDVDPGATYRYRVRLELRNPNFGRSLAAAGGAAHVVEGATRLTPWSEPTEFVTVQKNVAYFLTRLEQHRHRQHPQAHLNVFQYDTDLGTVVQQAFPVEFGQRIEGTVRAVLLDPAAGTRKEDEYAFQSSDTLLDALPDLTFDHDLHADLQLPAGSIGAARIPEYALVLADGELDTIDPFSQSKELARQRSYIEHVRRQLDHLRSDSDSAGDWQSEDERSIYEELFGAPDAEEDERRQPRRRNSLQR